MDINMDSIMKKVQEYAKKLSGDVSLNFLFPAEFIKEHTRFEDIEALLTPAGVVSQESFNTWKSSPSADAYISENTDFSSWEEMLTEATVQFVAVKQALLREGLWVDESFDTGVLFDDIHTSIKINAK